MKLIQTNYDSLEIETEKFKQILIVAGTGMGKTHAIERAIYNYLENGFIVIAISDVKDLLELGFIGMPTEIIADYHMDNLYKQNLEPKKAKIKLFHPLTSNIPSKRIPNTRFFSFSINALSEKELTFLIEDTDDKTTRELLLSALAHQKKNDSLWDYLLRVESLIQRKIKYSGSGESKIPDRDNFCLSGVSVGSLKNLDELARIYHRFQDHMILMPDTCAFNLDIEKELFQNPEEVKIFTMRYIKKDQKLKDFITLMLINQIVEKAENSRYPLLLIFDEIKDLIPSAGRVGYKEILANSLSHHLNTSFRANKITTISASQSFAGISKSLLKSNAFNHTMIGKIDGEVDIQNLKQIYNYDKEIIETIQGLKENEFLIRGVPELPINSQFSPFHALFSPFPHREPYMKFDSYFKRFFPNQMVNYNYLKKEINRMKKGFIEFAMKNKIEKIKRTEEEKREAEKEKEDKKIMIEKIKEMTKREKLSKKEERERRNKQIWELKEDYSQKDLADRFGLTQPMINTILKKFEALHNSNENNSESDD